MSYLTSKPSPSDSAFQPIAGGTPAERGHFVPIGVKFALVSLLVVGVAAAIAFFQVTHRERERLIDAKRIAASMVADLLAQSLQAPLDFDDEDAARIELDHLKQNKEVAYAGAWTSGSPVPLVEMRAPGTSFPLPADLETPRTVALPDRVETLRTVVGRAGKPIGTSLIQFSLARENAELAVVRRSILLYCLALALGTMVLLIGATRRQIVRPIETLLAAARRVEQGKAAAVEIVANDEIGRLATAFNAMTAAIFDREERLATANRSLRELFDHMRQGIVVFGADGKVEGTHSRAAGEIFGGNRLEGRSACDLLYADAGHWDAERRAFEEWLTLGFAAPTEHWAEVSALAPPRISLNAGSEAERDVTLEFRPIVHGGSVAKIMLLATDETDRRRLEREMQRQGARHKSQIAVMRRLVAGGGQQFVAFLGHARRRFERASELIVESGDSFSHAALGELFRVAHTIRAEAASFELTELAHVLASMEERLSELRERDQDSDVAITASSRNDLRAGVELASALVAQSEELFIEASPSGRAALDSVPVQKNDVERLVELCVGRNDEIARLVARLASRPFGECVASLVEQASAWAEKENKRVRVEVEGRDALVPPVLAGLLGGVLAHLVRNAIAHGIETVDERLVSGKPAIGSIELGCRSIGDFGAVIVIDDDGRGVAHNEFLARAAEAKLPLGAMGYGSWSTRSTVTELAGRGVGLSAVQADLGRVGYSVSVAAREGGGTRFEIKPGPGAQA